MWKFDESNDSKARNRLPLEARVQAIKAYEKTPNYSKVGLMFKCSSKQIRTIIQNKEQILAMYESFPKQMSDENKPRDKRRLKKIGLLGTVMYEWFLRARRNPSICIISYKLMQDVALEVKRIMNVENFYPNSAWLLNFRQKYNITDTDMKVQSNDPGPMKLDIESIVADVVVREKNNNRYAGSISSSSSTHNEGRNRTSDDCSSLEGNDDDGPPSKNPRLEPVGVIEIDSDDDDDDADVNDGDEDENSVIKTIDQALVHLKPLEDFALMREDYRVIGLISQLEVILRSSKDK